MNEDAKVEPTVKKPTCNIIVIDDFYPNPEQIREDVLKQEFTVYGNFPGERTRSFATEELKANIQAYIPEPIVQFDIPPSNDLFQRMDNGAFQYTTSRNRSWIHMDPYTNWAGVLFLTPNAPLTSGTGFYQFQDGTMTETDLIYKQNQAVTDRFAQDITKWKLVDQVGNVFNRLVLFNSKRFHMSMDYFGDTLENGRLFQVFFFTTKK